MNRLGLLSVTLVLLIGTSMAVDVSFKSGVNVTVGGTALTEADIRSGGLGFRLATNTYLLTGALSTSVGTSVSDSGAEIDIEVDAAFMSSTGGPVTVNARYSSDFTLPTLFTWNADTSANFIASFPYAIVEIDSTGADVAVHLIKDFTWSLANDLTVAASLAAKIGAKAFVGVNTINSNEVTLKFFAQTSAEVGISSFNDVDLLPRSWAFSMSLLGYTLQNAQNSLRLQQVVATGSADLSKAGQITVSGPNAKLQAFVDLATTATFDGEGISVDVKAFSEVTLDLASLFPTINSQIDAKYDSQAKIYLSNATFEAGANGFIYGGRSGTGLRLNEVQRASTPGSASSVSFGIALILASISMVALFF